MSKPPKAFITYSHKDLQRNTELKTRLAVMEDEGKIKLWDDNQILPGDEWEKDISENLAESDILLYLVSATSLASKNCNKELAEVLSPNIRVIPIILEACDWENHQLSRFEALPHKGKPINEWRPQSKGWQNVVAGVRKVVDEMQSQVDSPPSTPEDELRAELAFQQGNFLLMLRQVDGAIEAYSHAIDFNPHAAHAYNNRGQAYLIQNKIGLAIEDYTVAIQLNPRFAGAYNNRGIAYDGKGEYDLAIKDYNEAIRLTPALVLVFNNRGNTYYKKGCFTQAIKDLTTGIKLNPNYAEAYFNRGNIYRDKEEVDLSILDYNEAIRLKGDNVSYYYNRGNVYLSKQDYIHAVEDYTMVTQVAS